MWHPKSHSLPSGVREWSLSPSEDLRGHQPLNENVLREPHPIPKVDETLTSLVGATHFSKLDANSGFWQIPLSEESRPLITFIIRSVQQTSLWDILCPRTVPTQNEQDTGRIGGSSMPHRRRVGVWIKPGRAWSSTRSSSAAIARGRCYTQSSEMWIQQEQYQIPWSYHRQRWYPCRSRQDFCNFQYGSRSVSDLHRFMGLVNQLGNFSPLIAGISQPLRELMSSRRAWTWGPDQEKSFSDIKQELTKPTTLALYNPRVDTKVSADASSFGLGAVLLQRQPDDQSWRPVAYASRSLSDTEKRYVQIEKEALATTWACEKFSMYILGRWKLTTNHWYHCSPCTCSPISSEIGKDDFVASHIPEKLLYAFSCAPTRKGCVKLYWQVRGSLTICDDLLLYNSRIVIPPSLRKETMRKIHEGHQGWRGVKWESILSMVASYLKPDSELRGELSAVCKGRMFTKGATPTDTTAIPEVLRSDNGPQYASKEFSEFADEHNIQHVTSSPHFPQSNGQVERMVQTMKGLLKQSADPHLAVLSYNAMVWFESITVHGSKDQNHSTTEPQSSLFPIGHISHSSRTTTVSSRGSIKSIMTSDMESKNILVFL